MSLAEGASKRKSVRVQQLQIKRFKENTIGSSTHTADEENKENAAPHGKMAQARLRDTNTAADLRRIDPTRHGANRYSRKEVAELLQNMHRECPGHNRAPH